MGTEPIELDDVDPDCEAMQLPDHALQEAESHGRPWSEDDDEDTVPDDLDDDGDGIPNRLDPDYAGGA